MQHWVRLLNRESTGCRLGEMQQYIFVASTVLIINIWLDSQSISFCYFYYFIYKCSSREIIMSLILLQIQHMVRLPTNLITLVLFQMYHLVRQPINSILLHSLQMQHLLDYQKNILILLLQTAPGQFEKYYFVTFITNLALSYATKKYYLVTFLQMQKQVRSTIFFTFVTNVAFG